MAIWFGGQNSCVGSWIPTFWFLLHRSLTIYEKWNSIERRVSNNKLLLKMLMMVLLWSSLNQWFSTVLQYPEVPGAPFEDAIRSEQISTHSSPPSLYAWR